MRLRLLSSFAAAQPLGKAARRSSATSPTRQCSIAVISALSCSVRRVVESRKKSARTVDKRSRRAPHAGASWSAGGAAIGHSSGNITGRLIRFPLTSRQLGPEMTNVLNNEERHRRIDEERDEIGRPGARNREGNGRENGIAARQEPDFAVRWKDGFLDPRRFSEGDGRPSSDEGAPSVPVTGLPPTERKQGQAA